MVDHAAAVDPQGHRITFENEHVRVVEVYVEEGRSVPIHSHPARVTVAVGSYRMRSTDENGDSVIVERGPGDLSWSDGQIHAVEVISGPAHAVEVEIKGI
jgi:anti-sigma factor ChrR (cupin superfamily)